MCGSSCWLLVSTRGNIPLPFKMIPLVLCTLKSAWLWSYMMYLCWYSPILFFTFSGRNTNGRLCIRPCSLGSWYMGISRTPHIWKGKYTFSWVSFRTNTTEKLYSYFPHTSPQATARTRQWLYPGMLLGHSPQRGLYKHKAVMCSSFFTLYFWWLWWRSSWLLLCILRFLFLFYWTFLFSFPGLYKTI